MKLNELRSPCRNCILFAICKIRYLNSLSLHSEPYPHIQNKVLLDISKTCSKLSDFIDTICTQSNAPSLYSAYMDLHDGLTEIDIPF